MVATGLGENEVETIQNLGRQISVLETDFQPPHGPPGLFSSSSLFSQKSQIEIYSGKGVLKSEEEKRKWRRRLGGCR